MTELVKVNLSQYGLDEKKAAEIRKDFDAVLKIAEDLESGFNEVVKEAESGVTPELSRKARSLRLKFVKVRTGIAAVHKERKAFYLSGGRAVDGLKAAYTHAVEGNEQKLKAIEEYYERLEQARIEKLASDRTEALLPYGYEPGTIPIGGMNEDVWNHFFDGYKKAYFDELQTWTTSRWSSLQETKDERCGKCGRMFWHHIKAKMNLEI